MICDLIGIIVPIAFWIALILVGVFFGHWWPLAFVLGVASTLLSHC